MIDFRVREITLLHPSVEDRAKSAISDFVVCKRINGTHPLFRPGEEDETPLLAESGVPGARHPRGSRFVGARNWLPG